MNFASDNISGVHPTVLDALLQANRGSVPSYGADDLTAQVTQQIRTLFAAPDAAVYLVATGSAANALSLSVLCPPFATVFCHRQAHIEEDECGAPEFFTGGAKLCLVEGTGAKIDLADLKQKMAFTARAGVHNVQRGALSLSNVTEGGTVYTPDEVAALSAVAKSYQLPTHMDGARFANALVATGASPAEMTWQAGVDVLSLGGTKNGLMGVEAVILFDPAKAWEFELRRKRGGHLFSKARFLAAQMATYLQDDLWLSMARHANHMAQALAHELAQQPEVEFLYPRHANMIFAKWSCAQHLRLQAAGAYYYLWPFEQSLAVPAQTLISARLVTSWATQMAEIEQLSAVLKAAPDFSR